ncbi:MAG: ATP-binding cassette domain-containing protein [Ilumatobacter sp.]|uniref:sulfate/molybdate ABC transporter ATP-binding protein n=1 Tax=Ilumatobacter sp. TaxID=1967498 RepID=UPI003C717903
MSPLDAHIVRRIGSFDLDVSIRIQPGQTVALLGPNGAGKSTTVSALSGSSFDGETTGTSVMLGDRCFEHATGFLPPEARGIGVVFQDALLFEHLSVLDNVAFAARSRGASRKASQQAARGWLDRLDLVDLAHRRPAELSGGQAQRVAIARALASEPRMLLLDEPLSSLDVETRSEIRRMLREHLGEFEGPRLLVTHDPADAFLLADRIDVIEAGRITQSGSPDDIRRSPATPYVAALAGTNLFGGDADSGTVRLRDHDHSLTIADTKLRGAVLVTIHPTAISLHPRRPSGSQRNVWPTTVELVEPLGDTVRVTLGDPVPIAVDVTPGAVSSLGLTPGTDVWAAVKATEINATRA